MHKIRKQHSLIYDFSLFVSIIVFVVCAYSIHRIHTIQSQITTKELAAQAERVEKYFAGNTQYLGGILWFMGRQIHQHSSNNTVDLNYIDQLFQAFSADPNIQNILSSTIIGWVNTDYHAVVDGFYRVMKEPKDLSSRDYLPETVKEPWVIKLGQPIVGSTSGKWVIPAGVGITDNQGKWIGTLIIGLQQSFLKENFAKLLDSKKANIALVDMAGQILVETPTHFISNNLSIADKMQTVLRSSEKSSDMENKIPLYHTGYFGWGVNYTYYKIPHYDYALFLSVDNPLTFRALLTLLANYLPEIFTILLFFIMGGAFLRIRIIQPILTLSDTALTISKGNTDIAIPQQVNKEADNLAHALEKVKTLVFNEQTFKKRAY